MMKPITSIVLLTVNALTVCCDVRGEDLAKYVFRIPALEGMEEIRQSAYDKVPVGKNAEFAIIVKCFQSQNGVQIPAKTIAKFYYNHYASIGLIPWQKEDSLECRFIIPSIVKKGDAHVFNRGTIMYWIPRGGDFISFYIEQWRDYTVGETDRILSSIIRVFEECAREFGFTIREPENITIGDWPAYYENESFVEQRVCLVQYKEADNGCMGDDGNYMFRLSVYANTHYAAQRYRDMSPADPNNQENEPSFKRGLCFPPIVIRNVVIEYAGDLFDEPNPEFSDCVLNKLKDMAANNRLETIGFRGALKPKSQP